MVGLDIGVLTEKSTKNQIIQLLSHEWPLTAKEIHNRLTRKGTSISYQATHKTLKELEKQGTLENTDSKYAISIDWIGKVKDSADTISKNYSEPKNGKNSITLNSLYEADMYILDFALEHLPEQKTEMAWLWSHYWLPLFFSLKEYKKILEVAQKTESYSVVKGNTLVDKWCAKFWGDTGAHTLYNTDYGSKPDTLAFNDYVLRAHYPKEILKEMEKFFSKAKKFEDINPKYLFDKLFHKKTTIPITITKNQELCEQIITEAKNHFKEAGK